MTWLRHIMGLHVHVFGLWRIEERKTVLVSPLGRTEHTSYYNVRTCGCGFTEMKKAMDAA